MAELCQTFLDASFWVQAGIGILAVLLLVLSWQLFGSGPRRRRLLLKARKSLQENNWAGALRLLDDANIGASPYWHSLFQKAQADAHEQAVVEALKNKAYETAVEHIVAASRLLNKSETEGKSIVVDEMLTEVRRRFADRSSDSKAIHELLGRVLRIQQNCGEAYFWKALCHLRDGEAELASKSLESARAAQDSKGIDPPLYLGGLLMRSGKPKDALRYLTEANRIDARSPFVACALGTAMVSAGGDAALAARALARALGPQGFERWTKDPQRAWAEGLPEGASYIRKLAAKQPFHCPLWGADVRTLRHAATIALGLAYFRLGNFAEAKTTFEKLIHETAPTYAALRGLGLSLARLGQYDEAFTHLKTAYDMEDTKDRLTAGYLALCAAKARPARDEDKTRNILWAIRLVMQFQAHADAEWAGVLNSIFAEARQASLPLSDSDQLYLCAHLASVAATDSAAAEAYHHLMATSPEAVRSEHACLYGRAAQQQGHAGPASLALFARIFQDPDAAREFFERQQWDLDAVELTYLCRAAEREPGRFPQALGADYAARGERLLFEASKKRQQAGDLEDALELGDVLLKLSPNNPRAFDHLAQLWYRKGDLSRAIAVLNEWRASDAANATPLVRLAVLHQEMNDVATALERIEQALSLTQGKEHAQIAYLGARLALKSAKPGESNGESNGHAAKHLESAMSLLQRSLTADPEYSPARSLFAGLHWLAGDKRKLADLATGVVDGDSRQRYFASLANLAAGDYEWVKQLTGETSPELSYLAGWAAALAGEAASAIALLTRTAGDADAPSCRHAKALAGRLCLLQGQTVEGLAWWKSLDTETQKRWRIDEALGGAVFLSAIEDLKAEQYERAAERIREAGRLGCRDRRLGSLLTFALVKAGQKLLYARNEA